MANWIVKIWKFLLLFYCMPKCMVTSQTSESLVTAATDHTSGISITTSDSPYTSQVFTEFKLASYQNATSLLFKQSLADALSQIFRNQSSNEEDVYVIEVVQLKNTGDNDLVVQAAYDVTSTTGLLSAEEAVNAIRGLSDGQYAAFLSQEGLQVASVSVKASASVPATTFAAPDDASMATTTAGETTVAMTTEQLPSPQRENNVSLRLDTTGQLNLQNVATALVQAYANASAAMVELSRRRRDLALSSINGASGITYKVVITERDTQTLFFYVIEDDTINSRMSVPTSAYVTSLLRSTDLQSFLRDNGVVTASATVGATGACSTRAELSRPFLAIDVKPLSVFGQSDVFDFVKSESFLEQMTSGFSALKRLSLFDASTCPVEDPGGACNFIVCEVAITSLCDVTVRFIPVTLADVEDPEPVPIGPDFGPGFVGRCDLTDIEELQLFSHALGAFVQRTTYYFPELPTTTIATTAVETTATTQPTTVVDTTPAPTTVILTTLSDPTTPSVTTNAPTTPDPTTTTPDPTTTTPDPTTTTPDPTTTAPDPTTTTPDPTTTAPDPTTTTPTSTESTGNVTNACPLVFTPVRVEVVPPWMIVLLVIFIVFFVVFLVIVIVLCCKRNKGSFKPPPAANGDEPSPHPFEHFPSYRQDLESTFSETPAPAQKEADVSSTSSASSRISAAPSPPVILPTTLPTLEPRTGSSSGSSSSSVITEVSSSSVVSTTNSSNESLHVAMRTTDDEDHAGSELNADDDSDNEIAVEPHNVNLSAEKVKMEELNPQPGLFEESVALAPTGATVDSRSADHLPPLHHDPPIVSSEAQKEIDWILDPPPPSVFESLPTRNLSEQPSSSSIGIPPTPPPRFFAPLKPEEVWPEADTIRTTAPFSDVRWTPPGGVSLNNPFYSPIDVTESKQLQQDPAGGVMPATHGRNSAATSEKLMLHFLQKGDQKKKK